MEKKRETMNMDGHIHELLKEVDLYREAVNNAEAALDDAEKELDELLGQKFHEEME